MFTLERFAADLCWRSTRYRSHVRSRYCPGDFLLQALALIIPDGNGQTVRQPRSEDLLTFEAFLYYVRGTIRSVVSHSLACADSKIDFQPLDAVTENLLAASLAPSPCHQLIERLIELLLATPNKNVRRSRAIARLIKVLDGGARPRHAEYEAIASEARSLLGGLVKDQDGSAYSILLEMKSASTKPTPANALVKNFPAIRPLTIEGIE